MKHFYRLLTIMAIISCGATVFCGQGHAEGRQYLQLEMANSYTDYNELNLGNGEEPPYLPLKSHEFGYLPGVALTYAFINDATKSDYRIGLTFLDGNFTYDGTYNDTGVPIIGLSTAKIFDINLLASLYTLPDTDVSLYAGIGYHKWDRGVGMASDPKNGFMENYSWGYIPVGVRAIAPLGHSISIEPDVSARIMFAGAMAIPSNNLNFNLGNKVGVNAQIPIVYEFDKSYSFVLTPWASYSEIGKSNVVQTSTNYVWEPDSRTWQYGANIGVRLHF